MSDTRSSPRAPATAAVALADAIVAAALASSAHRRLLYQGHLGLEPEDLMAELAPRVNQILVIAGQELGVITIPGATLVPYLVAPQAGANAGSQGFAARLRNAFTDGATPGEIRILLVLDRDPVETVRTASEDVGALPEMAFRKLCSSIADAAAHPEPEGLIRAVASDFAARADANVESLDRLARFAAQSWPAPRAAAAALHTLGHYVGDPREVGATLTSNARWRLAIERALAPDKDLARELARQPGFNPAVVPTLINALGASGLDYSRFALEDLQRPPAAPVALARFATPLEAGGATATHSSASRLAAWLPGGGELRISLDRAPAPGQAVVAAWSTGETVACTVESAPPAAVLACPARIAWSFAELTITAGGLPLTSLAVAVSTEAGTWFPAESALQIDAQRGAFTVEQEPRVVAVAAGDSILSPLAPVMPASETGEVALAVTRYGGEEHAIPLLLVGEAPPDSDDPDDGDAGGESSGTGDDGSGGENPGSDGEGREDPGGEGGGTRGTGAEGVDPSPVHTALRFAAAGAPRPVSEFDLATLAAGTVQPPPEVGIEEGWFAALISPSGAQRSFLAGQGIEGCDGLALEESVLALPGSLTYTLARDSGTPRAVPHPTFERLRLPPSSALAAFETARATLFEALRAGPRTVYGIPASRSCRAAARDYCAAFSALLDELPPEGAYQRHLDRLVLCDAIEDPTSGSLVIAPTNPLTVAFYLALAEQADAWIAAGALPSRGDIDDLGCQYLAPFLNVSGTWYEAAPPPSRLRPPLLWRRLRPVVRTGGPADSDPRLIARRLQAFLNVFDVYADHRHSISVGFYDPGDAGTVVDALRAFYRPGAATGAQGRPHLDVHLIVPDRERPPRAVEEFLSNRAGDSNEANLLAQGRVQLHIWEQGDDLPFCHVSFVFRSPTVRDIRQVGLADRAPTTFAGGLATVPGRHIVTGANERIFYWGSFASELASAPAGDGGRILGAVTSRLHELVGGQADRIHPAMTVMAATTIPAEFMERVYERSAWVVHLDRMIGLEAFMPHDPSSARRYLIDYEDSPERGAGYDAITATERVEPYLDAIRRALVADLAPTERGLQGVLDTVNAVSGRWAIQLLRDAPHQIRERVGTITAIAAIRDLDGGFAVTGAINAVLALKPDVLTTPELRVSAPPLGRPACDDLAIINIPLGASEPVPVRVRLIEVKFLTAGNPDEGRARLQLDNIRHWLTSAFDPSGPSGPFRGRDLANLVRSATARARVFGLGAAHDPAGFELALAAIAAGKYTFSCEYWIGAERHEGELVALRLDSSINAARSALAGEGVPYGLIHLGRPAFERVAEGGTIDMPTGWRPASFDPPTESAPTAGPPDHTGPAPESSDTSAGSTGEQAPRGAAPAAAPADTAAEIVELGRALDQAARKYGLELEPIQPELAQAGPTVIRFRTRPLGRQTLKGVQGTALDLGREIGTAAGVIVAQEPFFITIDVPRRHPQIVRFADQIPELEGAAAEPGSLPFLLGMAPSGEVDIEDLARLPHLLIAGATGSGKSVLLRGIVASLVHLRPPTELQLLIIDPKQVDFLVFDGLPHLYGGALVTDPAAAVAVLADTIDHEIERRRPLLRDSGATSALEFYEQGGTRAELPQLIVVIDEFADLAGTLSRAERQDFLGLVQRYGQLTRAFGIYLVLATQRPSVQVITGEIKANLTARVALRVQSFQDSMTILGQVGAERLAERGDMLFSYGSRLERLQGFLVTARDAEAAGGRWR